MYVVYFVYAACTNTLRSKEVRLYVHVCKLMMVCVGLCRAPESSCAFMIDVRDWKNASVLSFLSMSP